MPCVWSNRTTTSSLEAEGFATYWRHHRSLRHAGRHDLNRAEIEVSMYGLRAGNVVRSMFWLTSPMLAKSQESGVACAACQTEIVLLRHQHAMQVGCSRSGVSGVRCRNVPIGSMVNSNQIKEEAMGAFYWQWKGGKVLGGGEQGWPWSLVKKSAGFRGERR